ncbi:hypothetical protein [Sphingobacterium sp. UBA6645]|uniref:hypothetical protein n=1 Tax=Sphingobacterium sp. UBA6645 TaxID=1947511 RepID=UPI0025D32760|nr:hypothetical protein [Sphingobacterium sp. UBA6645]
MKEAEEILFNHISKDVCVGFQTGMVGSIVNAMKEYAQQVAQQALENAAETIKHDNFRSFDGWNNSVKAITNPDNIPTI